MMNILEYIDWCMEQGMSEENAYVCADAEFNLNREEEDYE